MEKQGTGFLKKIEKKLESVGFFPSLIRRKKAVWKTVSEMERGLAGEKSSLAMLPALLPFRPVQKRKEVLALDVGGTNFRVARAKVGNEGVELGKVGEGFIPGLVRKITPDKFFDDLTFKIKDFVKKNDTLGFTFSYPVEILPGADGKLIRWTKEIKVPKMVGKRVGLGLNQKLKSKDFGDCRVVILNDTVATLLSGLSFKKEFGTLLGLVVGTGTNLAYVEKGKNVLKLAENLRREEIINMESGNLDLVKLGFSTVYDREVDEESKDPGQNTYEKAISGLYLPRLLRVIMRDLVRLGIVKDERPGFLEKMTSEQISEVIKIASLAKDDFKKKEFLGKNFLSDSFFEVLSCLCSWIANRSAQLVAVMLAGPIHKLRIQGDLIGEVAIVAEGAVFWGIPDYREKVEKSLKKLIECDFEFLTVPESGLVGAAIAAGLVSNPPSPRSAGLRRMSPRRGVTNGTTPI